MTSVAPRHRFAIVPPTARRGFLVAVLAVGLAAAGLPGAGATSTDTELTVAAARPRMIKISEDPYTNPTAYHQTQVEADTYAWGDTIVSGFQTGRYSNGGATNNGWATSIDGGQTWTHGFLPGMTPQADPPGPYPRVSD